VDSRLRRPRERFRDPRRGAPKLPRGIGGGEPELGHGSGGESWARPATSSLALPTLSLSLRLPSACPSTLSSALPGDSLPLRLELLKCCAQSGRHARRHHASSRLHSRTCVCTKWHSDTLVCSRRGAQHHTRSAENCVQGDLLLGWSVSTSFRSWRRSPMCFYYGCCARAQKRCIRHPPSELHRKTGRGDEERQAQRRGEAGERGRG
jgi:hypothetical protein